MRSLRRAKMSTGPQARARRLRPTCQRSACATSALCPRLPVATGSTVCGRVRRDEFVVFAGRAIRCQGFGSLALLERFNENTCSNNLSTRAFASNLKAKIPPFRLLKEEKGPRTPFLVPGVRRVPGPSGICSIFLSTAPNYRGGVLAELAW